MLVDMRFNERCYVLDFGHMCGLRLMTDRDTGKDFSTGSCEGSLHSWHHCLAFAVGSWSAAVIGKCAYQVEE